MEFRRLNITLLSAQGLKDVNHFSKMDVYADVSIAGYPQSRQRTPIDKNSGTNPKWNHRMEFVVDEPYLTKPGLSLLFSLKTQSTFGPDKEIGTATVPIHDLFRPSSPSAEQTVDYQVITTSGKPKGTLKFSYRFGDKFTHQPQPQPELKRVEEPVTAYPPPQYAYPPGQHAGPAYPPPAQAAAGYGYGAHPQMSGYGQGYQAPPPMYGYGPAYAQPQNPRKNKMGMGGGLGLGLGAGLLGGLLVGEMASDIGESAAYADGYGDAMGDFDF